MSLEDKEYVEGVLRGEDEAFGHLVRKYNRMGGAIAYGISGDFQQAEDIVQESFLKAYRALVSLRDPRKFKVWFAGIVRSKSLDALRTRKDIPVGELAEEFASNGKFRGGSVEEEQMQEESRQKILELVGQLPREDRTVLVLKHMEGLSYKEIAEITGVSVSSVESRLFRARRTLRKKLDSTRT